MDEPDRDGVQEVELLAASAPGDDEPCLLQLLQVLHHAEAGHREALVERVQRLPVLPEELVEQAPASGVGKRPEDLVHTSDLR